MRLRVAHPSAQEHAVAPCYQQDQSHRAAAFGIQGLANLPHQERRSRPQGRGRRSSAVPHPGLPAAPLCAFAQAAPLPRRPSLHCFPCSVSCKSFRRPRTLHVTYQADPGSLSRNQRPLPQPLGPQAGGRQGSRLARAAEHFSPQPGRCLPRGLPVSPSPGVGGLNGPESGVLGDPGPLANLEAAWESASPLPTSRRAPPFSVPRWRLLVSAVEKDSEKP